MCFEEAVTERAHFPCGHSVCSACNATLLQRGFLACPTCRTPREGVSQAAVEHSNSERTRQNEADERGDGGMGVGMTISHAGQRYRVLFFPDESEGSPFATLDMSGARPMRPMRAARTLRMMPPYHARPSARRGAVEAEEGNESESEGDENRPPGVPMRLDPSMEALVDGLLSPVELPEFLARRARV